MRPYRWIPGLYHPSRGYTLDEALAAVGDGWADFVRRGWTAVHEAGGEVHQVKAKTGYLRIYYELGPEASSEVEQRLEALVDEIEMDSVGVPEGENSDDPEDYAEEVLPPATSGALGSMRSRKTHRGSR